MYNLEQTLNLSVLANLDIKVASVGGETGDGHDLGSKGIKVASTPTDALTSRMGMTKPVGTPLRARLGVDAKVSTASWQCKWAGYQRP